MNGAGDQDAALAIDHQRSMIVRHIGWRRRQHAQDPAQKEQKPSPPHGQRVLYQDETSSSGFCLCSYRHTSFLDPIVNGLKASFLAFLNHKAFCFALLDALFDGFHFVLLARLV